MKRFKLKNMLLGVVTLAAASIALQAQATDGWYIGVGVSQADVDERGIDDDDSGGKIYGGYRFNDFFAIEGNYYDFGETSSGANELGIDGVGIAAVGSIPLSNQFMIFGKIGYHAWDADIKGPIASQFADDSDEDLFYGVGLEYAFNQHWNIRGEYELYEVDDFDIDVVSVGVSYHF